MQNTAAGNSDVSQSLKRITTSCWETQKILAGEGSLVATWCQRRAYCIADNLLPPRKMGEGKGDCRVQVIAFNLDTYVLLKGQAGRA